MSVTRGLEVEVLILVLLTVLYAGVAIVLLDVKSRRTVASSELLSH
jgi:hypothetical protein